MIHAAESGNTPAIALMLDLGFPVDARQGTRVQGAGM